jgi:hypothetical protein
MRFMDFLPVDSRGFTGREAYPISRRFRARRGARGSPLQYGCATRDFKARVRIAPRPRAALPQGATMRGAMQMTVLNPLPPQPLPRHPEAVLRDALDALRSGFFDGACTACDYGGFARSAELAGLASAAGALAAFDPKKLNIPQQIAFWLNCYNALLLQAVVRSGVRDSIRKSPDFFQIWRYRIAGHEFSLNDIEHGVLRGNAARYGHLRGQFERSDPRVAYITLLADARVHFGMYGACRSSPALRVFHGQSIEDELETATRDFLWRTVEVSPDGAVVRVPEIFKWYAGDFGGDDDVLEFVVARMEDQATVDRIDARLGRVSIHYLKHDWALNARG